MIRVLLAHDDPLQAGKIMARLNADSRISLFPLAPDLTAAFNAAEHERPDVIMIHHRLTDLPEFELMRALLRALRVLCVLCSSKGPGQTMLSQFARQLPIVDQHISSDDLLAKLSPALARAKAPRKPVPQGPSTDSLDRRRVFLIGSSTGGVDALIRVIQHFDHKCPPTFIVQHTGSAFSESLTRLLSRASQARVQPARHGERAEPGNIYVAPGGDHHLRLSMHETVKMTLSPEARIGGHRPAIDALFQSSVPFAHKVSAALLTGMGQDGADGLLRLREAGARTIGQDEATSVVYGMPRVAYEIGAVEKQLPIQKIGAELLRTAVLERQRT